MHVILNSNAVELHFSATSSDRGIGADTCSQFALLRLGTFSLCLCYRVPVFRPRPDLALG